MPALFENNNNGSSLMHDIIKQWRHQRLLIDLIKCDEQCVIDSLIDFVRVFKPFVIGMLPHENVIFMTYKSMNHNIRHPGFKDLVTRTHVNYIALPAAEPDLMFSMYSVSYLFDAVRRANTTQSIKLIPSSHLQQTKQITSDIVDKLNNNGPIILNDTDQMIDHCKKCIVTLSINECDLERISVLRTDNDIITYLSTLSGSINLKEFNLKQLRDNCNEDLYALIRDITTTCIKSGIHLSKLNVAIFRNDKLVAVGISQRLNHAMSLNNAKSSSESMVSPIG
jgi:hypothetical protein